MGCNYRHTSVKVVSDGGSVFVLEIGDDFSCVDIAGPSVGGHAV